MRFSHGVLISGIMIMSVISLSSFSQEKVFTNPIVQKAKHFRVTKPLREMEQIQPGERDRSWKDQVIRNEENVKTKNADGSTPDIDPTVQHRMGSVQNSGIYQNFDGINNVNGVYPPDTDGDVGPNHYFQMVNLSFAIYSKSGTLLYGPVDNSTLWNGFVGPWTGTNDGDPIVLYDELADRWLASQFAVNTSNGTYWELIAISTTSDPTGSYYQYAFQFPDFNDYPKFGVWHDGYYASFNIFGSYNRAAAAAFERDSMLVGNPNAQMVLFDLPSGSDPFSMLPADFDGTPPPAGTPNYFAYFNDDAWGYPNDQIRIWEFDVDWVTPSNSTFSESQIIQPSPFDSEICSAYRGRCIDQPSTTRQLETIGDRLMFRLQYRNFGSYEVLLTNHTVDAGSGVAGIRWYEFRDTGSGWTIHQQSTYSPDNLHRWMGSIAMDSAGNIALGYSVSSSSVYPSIRYTGRLAGNPLNQMTITEDEIKTGAGSQTGSACRWGDYSMMAVDPADPTVFWYTTEYLQTTGTAPWRTRIASFEIQMPMPTANAGPDTSTCENYPVDLNGSATNYSNVVWTTTGDGTFSPASMLNTTYSPGTMDVSNGGTDLILTAYAIPPSTDTISDTLHLSIIINPSVDAGNDSTICENNSFTTQPTVLYADSILWETNGDGHFNDSTLVNSTYYPGPSDITSGFVLLELTGFPTSPCQMTNFDMLSLNIQALPSSDAGLNDTVCEGETVYLSGNAEDYSSVLWTSSGDGTFNDPTSLYTEYLMGSDDILNGGATLSLTAYPEGVCSQSSVDSLYLIIHELPNVDAGENQTIPYGTITTLTGTASGGSGNYNVLWEPSDLVVNPDSLITETFNLEYTNTFTLTVTDLEYGCEDVDEMDVIVEGGELWVEASANPEDVCVGDSTLLEAVASGGSGVYTYEWESDPPGFYSTLQAPYALPDENTTYTVIVNDGYNTAEASTYTFTEDPPIVLAGEDTTICHFDIASLTGSAENYEWTQWSTEGDGYFEDETSLTTYYYPGIEDINNGGVFLTLSGYPNYPCTHEIIDSLNLTINICPGIQEGTYNDSQFKVIPNPNSGTFKIITSHLQCDHLVLKITDLVGQVKYTAIEKTQNNRLEKTYRMEELGKGIFMLQLQCKDQILTQRLIIQ